MIHEVIKIAKDKHKPYKTVKFKKKILKSIRYRDKYMLFKTSKKKIQTLLLQMDNKIIDKVLEFNFLGIHFNEQLNWKGHINKLSVKCCRILGILNRLKRILPLKIKIILYNSLMLPHLNYDITLWGFKCERILKLQKKAARILSASKYNAHTEPLLKNLKLLKIEHILKLHELKLYYNFIHIITCLSTKFETGSEQ